MEQTQTRYRIYQPTDTMILPEQTLNLMRRLREYIKDRVHIAHQWVYKSHVDGQPCVLLAIDVMAKQTFGRELSAKSFLQKNSIFFDYLSLASPGYVQELIEAIDKRISVLEEHVADPVKTDEEYLGLVDGMTKLSNTSVIQIVT